MQQATNAVHPGKRDMSLMPLRYMSSSGTCLAAGRQDVSFDFPDHL